MREMRIKSFVGVTCTCLAVVSFNANAHIFIENGSLSTIDGIFDTGTDFSNLNWSVNHVNSCCDTGYTYTFNHSAANTFEFIIELHPNMVSEQLNGAIYNVNSTLSNYELGFFTSDVSTPGMPETIAGVRFWGDGGNTTESISFSSDYLPMWGDFYATNAIAGAWNVGFTNPDTDPLYYVSGGSRDFHMLVPGAGGLPIIPVPTAFFLFSSGLIGLVGFARRKT